MENDKRDYSFKAFEAVITYAIDENSVENQHSILNDIGLTEDSFYESVYLKRSKKEKELEIELRKDQAQISIIGNPGTGKTTLVRKVLSKLEKEENAYIVFIDFKKLTGINDESNSSFEKLSTFIKETIKSRIQSFLNAHNISDNEVVDYLIHENDYQNSRDFDNPNFIELQRKLFDLFEFETSKQGTFKEWYEDQRTKKRSSEFKQYFLPLASSIRPHNYFRYIAFSKAFNKSLCVLCFDNVDSIVDNSVRNQFCKFFRKYQGILKQSVKSVITMRATNPSIKSLSDAGAYIISPIHINYEEFIDKKLLDNEIDRFKSKHGSCSHEDKIIIQSKLVRLAREKFSKSIYEKRVAFVKDEVNEEIQNKVEKQNKLDTINQDRILELEGYFNLLLDTNRLRIAFLDLCNFDRREMLVQINNFIHYLIYDVKIDLDSLNLDKAQRQFILESYFYGWITTYNKFIEKEIYNIPKDTQDWIDGSKLVLECSLDHLIFCAIFNLSELNLNEFSFEKSTKVKTLTDCLFELGYDEQVVKDRILFLFKNQITNSHKGLLELSHFHDVNAIINIKPEDEISITPRTFYLLSYSNLKFISIISLIRSTKIKVNEKLFKYDDRDPITKNTIDACLRLFCHLAEMHLNGLNEVKSKLELKGYENWFQYYRKTFCLRVNKYKPYNDEHGELLFLNLINSCIKFLKHQQSIEEDLNHEIISNKMIIQMSKLKSTFQNKVQELIDDKYDQIEKKHFFNAINLDH